MKKVTLVAVFAVATAALVGAFATTAIATPASTSPCLGACHAAGPGATITATLGSMTDTSAIYNVVITGTAGSAWAVFDGTTRVVGSTTSTDSFTVDRGKTYDLFAVDHDSNKAATSAVSPAAPAEPPVSLDETLPPVTTSDAKTSYQGDATVSLDASDGQGRGVAYMYYRLDGGIAHLFTVGMLGHTSLDVPAPLIGTAPHTLTFWSQDKAGNVEAQNTANFTVAALPPAPPAKRATGISFNVSPTHVTRNHHVTIGSFRIGGGVPSGTVIRVEAHSGSRPYTLISSRTVSSTGYSSSFSYKVTKTGHYYVRVRFLGDSSFLASTSGVIRITVK